MIQAMKKFIRLGSVQGIPKWNTRGLSAVDTKYKILDIINLTGTLCGCAVGGAFYLHSEHPKKELIGGGLVAIPCGMATGIATGVLTGVSLSRANATTLGISGVKGAVFAFLAALVFGPALEQYHILQPQNKHRSFIDNNISLRRGFYRSLPQQDKVTACYIWIDGTHENLRCKSRTLDSEPKSPEDLPIWNYDGWHTYQAEGSNSDVYLHPVALYPDPFTGGKNKLVLCETYNYNKKPTESNKRRACADVMTQAKDFEPWFEIEQEYSLLDVDRRPLVSPKTGLAGSLGIKIHFASAGPMPAQWKFRIGPCEGISAGDQLWISRYLLHRVAEDFGVLVSFSPTLARGDWNVAGGEMSFSTKAMRTPGKSLQAIEDAIEKLGKVHANHIRNYDPKGGQDNQRRLTGRHETSSIHDFSAGVANRGCSIRIPRQVAEDGHGYLEDRRPASNCDPYSAKEITVRTTCLDQTVE
ncbi:glutamine synthetase-like isoform X2 [Paramacrobiotus metropolitanus]|uniref:glutamine synthetase-like isoform X2 n=1 Tax=Paramacrobiotus metropolitanus TaxID=2943436 RepID=UPI00244581B8|nr:glutamine synthetase-like isoform X2 [Paramacrobiotus metropolitanus]